MEKEDKEPKAQKEIMVVNDKIVQPAVSATEALKQFKAFQEIKNKVLTGEDKQPIAGNPYIRKTGWRKIKTIFNLSEEILESKREIVKGYDNKDKLLWTYRVRVKAKNGAFADAEMSCDSDEDFSWSDKAKTKKKPETMIMAMAQTRAFNRATSDLVGGGECSAEEMMGIEKDIEGKNKPFEMPKDPICSKCKAKITEKVYKYSMEHHNVPLCYACQQGNTVDAEYTEEEPVM